MLVVKLNDVAPAVPLELLKQGGGPANAFGEGRMFHRPANLDVPAFVCEIEHLALDLDVRHIFAKIDRPGLNARCHTPTPDPEQAGIGTETGGSFKINMRPILARAA